MSKTAQVNTTDIAAAIQLGCRTMQRVFNADDDQVPFFGSTLRPQAALHFSAHHSESHVPGRHLNALLNAEDAVGIDLDESAVENHRRGAVGSLCEAYREVARRTPTGTWVNLLFDHHTPQVRVRSPYTGRRLIVEPLVAGPLFVRLPPWVNPGEVQIEGVSEAPVWTKGYLFFARPSVRKPISIDFPLKTQDLVLSGRVHIHPIRVRLQGDAVVAMDTFGADLTFFDPYE